jgi:ABC-type glycerol-3-phosphate transport system permease component
MKESISQKASQTGSQPGNNVDKLKRIPEKAVKQAMLISLSIGVLFPLYFMFSSAFKSRLNFNQNQLAIPKTLNFENFLNVLQHPNLVDWFRNSLILTGVSVLLTTTISLLAAYAFGTMVFRGRNTLFNLITPLMVIPPIVMIIPLFVLFQHYGLVNNLWGTILIYSGLMLPFTIFLLRSFVVTIPREILEAAQIDGANEFQLMVLILLPLLRPALITSMIVNAVWVWNELLIALVFLQEGELRTLIVGISTGLQKRFSLDVPALMAGLAIATIPMILLYVIGQNALVRGLTAGFER